MTTPIEKALPVPTGETQPFWDGCRKHELRIQQCIACRHYQFYPRLYCTACMSAQCRVGQGVRPWDGIIVYRCLSTCDPKRLPRRCPILWRSSP